MAEESRYWPTEIKVSRDRRQMTVRFDDGATFEIPAELLRVNSPSAEVQGHSPSQRVVVPGKREVEIVRVMPTGTYAVRIVFDDLHETGIYTWDYLRKLGENRDALLESYFEELAEKGLSREKQVPRR
ncbi:MAG TPA: DUF971 domain-containing protein [Pararhizobium sp.]|nr:DUF971 domain-containing protein [Pararhizobium sp.]